MKSKIRKLESTMSISGLALIFLAAWSVIKNLLVLIGGENDASTFFTTLSSGSIFDKMFLTLTLIVWAVQIAISIYIGISVRKAARGEKNGVLYLVVAFILATIYLVTFFLIILGLVIEFDVGLLIDVIIVSIVDGSVLFVLCEIIISAIRLKKLKKMEANTLCN